MLFANPPRQVLSRRGPVHFGTSFVLSCDFDMPPAPQLPGPAPACPPPVPAPDCPPPVPPPDCPKAVTPPG